MIRIPLLFLVLVNLNWGNCTDLNQDYSSTISTESIDLSEVSNNETFKTIVESKDLKKDVELSSKIKQYIATPIFQENKVEFTLSGFVVDNFVGGADYNSLKINVGGKNIELRFFRTGDFISWLIMIGEKKYDINAIENNERFKVDIYDNATLHIDGKGPFALGSINTESANKKRKAVKMIFDASGMRGAIIKLSFTTSLGKDKKPVVLISGVAAACVVVLIIIGIAIIWCCVSPKCLFYKKFRNQKKVDVKNQPPPKIDGVDHATQIVPVHHETRSNALVNQPQPRRVPSKERRSRNRRTSSNNESDAQPEPVAAVNVNLVNRPESVAPVNQPANVDPVNRRESVAPDNRPEPVAPVNQPELINPVNRSESVAAVDQHVDKEKSPKKTSSKETKNRNRRSSSNGSDAQPESTAQVNPSANVERERSSKPNKVKSTEKGDTRSNNNESDAQPGPVPPVHRPVNAETEKPSQPNAPSEEIQRAAREENGVSRSQSVEVDKEKKQNDEPATSGNQKKEDNSGYSKNENVTESVASVDQHVKGEKEELKKAASDGRVNNAENATTSADVVEKRNESTVADENNAVQSTVEQPAKTEDAANESKKAEDEAAVHPGPSNLPDASQPGPSGVAVIKGQSLSDFVFDLFSRYGEKNPAEAVFAYIYEGKTTYKMPQKMSDPPTEEQKREALEYYYQDFAIRFKEQHKSGKKKKRRKSKSSDDTIAE